MKVLFLDIDGVLNRDGTKERVRLPLGDFVGVDGVLLERFLTWIARHKVSVVLSSTWRLHEAMQEHLNSLGIFWMGVTPRLGSFRGREIRGREIEAWLKENKTILDITHFAILDDMSDMAPLGKALVQTSERRGLEEKHLRRLEKILDLKSDADPAL